MRSPQVAIPLTAKLSTRLAVAGLALSLTACAQTNPGKPPPAVGQPFAGFYYPTGVAYVPDANGGPGFVYVVSSDFDLRFNRGTLASMSADVRLDDGGPLPTAANAPASPVVIGNVMAPLAQQVDIDVFGGPVALAHLPNTGPNARRLFVAGRQVNALDAVDLDGANLACAPNTNVDAGGAAANDCSAVAAPLGEPIIDAYRPLVVNDQVYVGALTPLDNPRGSDLSLVAYLARVNALTMGDVQLFAMGAADTPVGSEAPAALEEFGGLIMVGSRPISGANTAFTSAPLRVVPEDQFETDAGATAIDLSTQLNVRDIRSMVLASDRTRLYMTTRSPDALAVLDVTPDVSGSPRFEIIGAIPLPSGAAEIALIPRGPGRRDLVAVSCENTNVVAIYDDEIGRVVTELRGVGEQPFGLAVGPVPGGGSGARLYTTAFGRGDLAITEIPDLDNPASAVVLATVGPNENCLNDTVSARPPECPQ
ncbi:MAG: hypothetical protein JST54_26940 [Deltaproteobacteria bacterium]|nr:hypothetical protein [Deltaproteobacteria bacterium]